MTRRRPELHAALKAADARVALAARTPASRLKLRVAFYERKAEYAGYARSELAFLEYEVSRGVLDRRTGSAWWRRVNEGLLRDAERATAWFDAEETPDQRAPAPQRFWFDFLTRPSEATWYRAHNGSIFRAALAARPLAHREDADERHFVGEVLDRVALAHAMAAGKASELLALAAAPQGFAVELLLKDPALYPPAYPAPRDVASLAERVLELPIAMYRPQLYAWAADELRLRALDSLALTPYPGAAVTVKAPPRPRAGP